MSVDTRVVFPPETRVSDVVKAIAILLGYAPRFVPLGSRGGKFVEVETKDAICLCIPEMVTIQFPERSFWGTYHFEAGNRGERLLVTGHDPDRFPLLIELARFFGGKIDLSDCDNIDYDRAFDYPYYRESNAPEDGESWDRFEQELFDLKDKAEEIAESVNRAWPIRRIRHERS